VFTLTQEHKRKDKTMKKKEVRFTSKEEAEAAAKAGRKRARRRALEIIGTGGKVKTGGKG